MSDQKKIITYSSEFCTLAENARLFTPPVFLLKCQELITTCYLHMLQIPPFTIEEEVFPFNLLTESDWFVIHDNIKEILKEHDSFREVFDTYSDEADGALSKSIAEEVSDIYQDLKNFTESYEENPDHTLWVCQKNFEEYWGQKAVNVMRAIHHLLYSDIDWEEEEI